MENKICAICGLDTAHVGLQDPWDIYHLEKSGLVFDLCLTCLGAIAQSLVDEHPELDMGKFWLSTHIGIEKIGE